MTSEAINAALDQARSALEPLVTHPIGPTMVELTMRSVTQAITDETPFTGDIGDGIQALMFRFAAYGIAAYERDRANIARNSGESR